MSVQVRAKLIKLRFDRVESTLVVFRLLPGVLKQTDPKFRHAPLRPFDSVVPEPVFDAVQIPGMEREVTAEILPSRQI